MIFYLSLCFLLTKKKLILLDAEIMLWNYDKGEKFIPVGSLQLLSCEIEREGETEDGVPMVAEVL